MRGIDAPAASPQESVATNRAASVQAQRVPSYTLGQGQAVPLPGQAKTVPSGVHEGLGPGQPLSESARGFFEPRLGQDLRQVRVHTDARASESAQAMDALAYTTGQDIVFGAGQYAPETHSGRRLIAHELTHVVQQQTAGSAAVQRQAAPGQTNALDARARAIISAAQDATVPLNVRAVETVRRILSEYYPSEVSKVSAVTFLAGQDGLATSPVGTGATLTGAITVGRNFVEGTNNAFFARRVLQVGHELRHVDQQRAGMGGEARRHEREFLAHHWAATSAELPGTGRVNHSTRVAMIDAALGHLVCLSPAQRAGYATQEQALLALRRTHQAASGHPPTPAPTVCDPNLP